MISMRCDEEVLSYLTRTREVWTRLLHHDEHAMRLLDQATVKFVELRAPKSSERDAQALHAQLVSGQIFSAFTPEDRETIWSELRTISDLIPSLFTFFEDLKYLEACAGSMRYLVNLSPRHTLRRALENRFFGMDQCVIQKAQSTYSIQLGKSMYNWHLAYRQLWLYTMRHCTELPALRVETPCRKKNLLAKVRLPKADQGLLSDFAALADQLGFQTEQISALRQCSADQVMAREALLQARRPDRYEYDQSDLESHVDQILKLFATAKPRLIELPCPPLVSDDPDASLIRCGFPDEKAHAQNSRSLFIGNLHAQQEEQGQSITSFFVRRSVYFAFFGRSAEIDACIWSSTAPSPPHPDADQTRASPIREPPRGVQGGSRGEPVAVPEPMLAQEPDQQESGENEINLRRGTQMDIERILADGLVRTLQASEHQPESRPDNTDLSPNQHQQIIVPAPQVRIEFKILEGDRWKTDRSLLVNRSEPSEVERVARKYMRKHFRPFDTLLNPLVPQKCFQVVTANGTNTVVLIPEEDIRVPKQLEVTTPASDAEPSTARRRRRDGL